VLRWARRRFRASTCTRSCAAWTSGPLIWLDPWWNPAVEAQAIDRTHRPGQTRPVVAYRLIGQGTVEDKILELQAGKRALAAGIFADDGGGLAGLSAGDLELLFS